MGKTQNKVKFNLKNAHVAKLTKTVDESTGAITYSYGAPKSLPGSVNLSLDAQGESNPFHADGIVYYRSNSNNGYSGDLELALVPEWFREEILQETKDANGVLIERSDITDSVYFALLFEFDGDKYSTRHVLYNCTASRPKIESKTKEDSIEPVTETLTISADPREDYLVKGRTGVDTDDATYTNWFKAVHEPPADTEG